MTDPVDAVLRRQDALERASRHLPATYTDGSTPCARTDCPVVGAHGHPELNPPAPARGTLTDFQRGWEEGAKWERQKSASADIASRRRQTVELAIWEVLDSYQQASWSIDGLPDVGPRLVELGQLFGLDVWSMARKMRDDAR